MLRADREPYRARIDSAFLQFFLVELGMRRACGMNDERFQICHICQQGEDVEPVDERFCRRLASISKVKIEPPPREK